jgi:hypothetical protein
VYADCLGYSIANACTCPGIYIYQQQGYYSPASYSFVYQANCQASTCDWTGYRPYYYTGFNVVYVDYFCGYVNYSTAGYCSYSDVSLKSGIETLQNALENIMNIEAVEYDWNENLSETAFAYFKEQQKLHTIGLIAQNVRLYYPETVNMNSDGYYSIDYKKLNAVLVEGIKQQEVFIEDIDKQLEYIESKLN